MTQASQSAARGGSRSTQLALPRSAVRLLAACARSEQLCPALGLRDAAATGFFEQLAGAGASFGLGELRCSAFRASVVDELAEDFFARNPSGVGVSIWPLLGTRAHRLRRRPWLDLDPEPIAALRERYLPPRSTWTQQASCLCSVGKVAKGHGAAGPRLFVLDESVLPLQSEVLIRVLDSLCQHAAVGSELLLSFDARAPVHRSRTGNSLEMSAIAGERDWVRYPRLRFVASSGYTERLRNAFAGINAVAQLQGGDAPALAHLQFR